MLRRLGVHVHWSASFILSVAMVLASCGLDGCVTRTWNQHARLGVNLGAYGLVATDVAIARHYRATVADAGSAEFDRIDRDFAVVERAEVIAARSLRVAEAALNTYERMASDAGRACPVYWTLVSAAEDLKALARLLEAVGIPIPGQVDQAAALLSTGAAMLGQCASARPDGGRDGSR